MVFLFPSLRRSCSCWVVDLRDFCVPGVGLRLAPATTANKQRRCSGSGEETGLPTAEPSRWYATGGRVWFFRSGFGEFTEESSTAIVSRTRAVGDGAAERALAWKKARSPAGWLGDPSDEPGC